MSRPPRLLSARRCRLIRATSDLVVPRGTPVDLAGSAGLYQPAWLVEPGPTDKTIVGPSDTRRRTSYYDTEVVVEPLPASSSRHRGHRHEAVVSHRILGLPTTVYSSSSAVTISLINYGPRLQEAPRERHYNDEDIIRLGEISADTHRFVGFNVDLESIISSEVSSPVTCATLHHRESGATDAGTATITSCNNHTL